MQSLFQCVRLRSGYVLSDTFHLRPPGLSEDLKRGQTGHRISTVKIIIMMVMVMILMMMILMMVILMMMMMMMMMMMIMKKMTLFDQQSQRWGSDVRERK